MREKSWLQRWRRFRQNAVRARAPCERPLPTVILTVCTPNDQMQGLARQARGLRSTYSRTRKWELSLPLCQSFALLPSCDHFARRFYPHSDLGQLEPASSLLRPLETHKFLPAFE